ncbi:MAG: hypothetical protein V3U69_06360 [Bacteroidota bacterium]
MNSDFSSRRTASYTLHRLIGHEFTSARPAAQSATTSEVPPAKPEHLKSLQREDEIEIFYGIDEAGLDFKLSDCRHMGAKVRAVF